ncbi:MAG: DNA helicase RecQ [Lawsonibacter sp.]|jgi:ATP-dependent DNA helicase RecQ|nr:DNA helicase RecQ [Lawsonibacter sp.]
MDKQEALRHYFGHSAFRPGQERLIDAVLDGRDVLGVMPTGGGKSLCYQVPALLLPGVTLVVSPLISLMKDQVAALQAAGAPAACLNSALSLEQLRTVYSRARQGAYKLLYVAPERLEGEGFDRLVRELEVPLVAVDEAHCISQWGQDFRPSYLRISAFLEGLPRRPAVAAFTATATGPVQQDIVQLLALRDPVREVTGFDRPNLFFDVQHPRSKLAALLKLVEERPGRSGIVYCATRSGVEKVCQALEARGVSATRYHAGLEPEERQRNQDDFQFDRKAVMVATNAFGMGIDKSNVSYVVHYNMPKSLEAYYQEAGRAGRDGEAADCILLYSAGDIATARFLIENGGNEELTPEAREAVRRHDYQRLSAMTGYCRTTACLRGRILDYFGQSHDASCGSCGNCRGEFASEDITVSAQMILSCVVRVREKLGYYVGKTLIVQVLRGSRDQRVRDLGLDKLSTFGLMAQLSAGRVRELMEFLELEGFLRINPAHSTLEPAGKARSLLFAGERLSMPLRKDRVREKKPASKGTALPEAGEERLLAALRTLRARLAQAEGVPAYIVFSNATLADMARRAPRTMEAFLEVSGVGRVKAAKYGEAFLRVIQECSAN